MGGKQGRTYRTIEAGGRRGIRSDARRADRFGYIRPGTIPRPFTLSAAGLGFIGMNFRTESGDPSENALTERLE